MPFPEMPSPSCRFYFRGSPFPYPDAIFLYSFLRYAQPKQIIEVGSGFSSAVILDTVDRFFPQRPKITFIEPYPINLNRLLRPDDRNNVTVHGNPPALHDTRTRSSNSVELVKIFLNRQ